MADLSLDEILTQAEDPAFVRVATARLLLRQDLVSKHADLAAELAAAVAADRDSNEPDRAPTIVAELQTLEAEIEAAKVEFRFRAIGHRAWADLLAQHPPSREQRAARLDHDPATFPLAAMVASCVAPKLTVEGMQRLERHLTEAQFIALWSKCIEANVGGDDSPKAPLAGLIRRANAASASSVTEAAEPSLEASSLDE